jgi:hypothetical protein
MIWFTVDSVAHNFPVYLKNSLLNSNPGFDYGPFIDLQNLILQQNVTVTQFSFAFNQKGNYVFEDYTSHKLTIISVVGSDESCSNSDAGGASEITAQTLSEIGIVPKNKSVDTRWTFMSAAYVLLFIGIIGVVGIVSLGQNL